MLRGRALSFPGSKAVSDSALKRACYVTRVMLADHAAVREWYYKLSGRVAVIGVNENTTQIPEHSYLPDSFNTRARGLGATASAPVSTAGEENVSCFSKDRYRKEDILIHELAHGVHLIGARYAIPQWENRLKDAYNKAKDSGLWQKTYALTNFREYFVSKQNNKYC